MTMIIRPLTYAASLGLAILLFQRHATAFVAPPSCCTPNVSVSGLIVARIVDWTVCGRSLEYVSEDGDRFCTEPSDVRKVIQGLAEHVPRKTITDKTALICKESLVHVDTRGEIRCADETCSKG